MLHLSAFLKYLLFFAAAPSLTNYCLLLRAREALFKKKPDCFAV